MRLSLLRAPKQPDTECDMGVHHFKYALLPHEGTFQQAGVIQHGLNFNVPLQASLVHLAAPTESTSFFSLDNKSVLIDTVKKAEDSNALVIRLYEATPPLLSTQPHSPKTLLFQAFGGSAKVRLSTSLPVARVWSCNILEEHDEELAWSPEKGVELSFTPFKFQTLKVELASSSSGATSDTHTEKRKKSK